MLSSSFLFGVPRRGSLLGRSWCGGGCSRLTGAARMPSLMPARPSLAAMAAPPLPPLHPAGSGGLLRGSSGRSRGGRSGLLCFGL